MARGDRRLADDGTWVGWMLGVVMVLGVVVLPAGVGRAANRLAGGSLEMPVAPPGHVLDAGEVFVRHPDKLEEISTALKEIEKEHGVPVYLVVYSGLIRTSVTRQARDLFDLWVGPGKDGIVVVCDTDEARVDLGLPTTSYDSLGEDPHISRLPDSEIVPIVRELKRDVDGTAEPVVYIPKMVEILTARLDEVLSVEKAKGWKDASSWKVGLATILLGILVGVIGFWVSRYLRLAEEKAREQFFFPEVLVPSRLGANFGGGKVAVVQFAGDEGPADDESPPEPGDD